MKNDPMYNQDPFHWEWTGHMALKEMEYRALVPEAKVVDKLKLWIEAYGWVPTADSLKMWQDVEAAIKELDDGLLERLRIAQEHYDARFGGMSRYVPEVTSKDDEELQEIYAG